MRWYAEQIHQSNSEQSQQPLPAPQYPHLQQDTPGISTHCLWHCTGIPCTSAASELHVHRQSMNWSKFYSRFSKSFCRAFHTHTVPRHDNSHSGDPLQTNPPEHIPSAVPLYCPTDRTGFALDCAHKALQTSPYQNKFCWDGAVFFPSDWGFGLHVWLMTEKAKACILVFNQFYPWDNLDYFVMFL